MFDSIKGKKVLVTGHTGFEGSWLTVWLHLLGAKVYGYALPPAQGPTLYFLADVKQLLKGETLGDIRDQAALQRVLRMVKPDMIFHLVGQASASEARKMPVEAFDVNLMGTLSLMEALREAGRPCTCLYVSSEKAAAEQPDLYSASKAAADTAADAYCRTFFGPEGLDIRVAGIRHGNTIGGGDFTEGRLIPECVNAAIADETLGIRAPASSRPWQHILDPLAGYLTLAEKLATAAAATGCTIWNFAPPKGEEKRVGEVADAFFDLWESGGWETTGSGEEGSKAIALDTSRSEEELGWRPRWDFDEALKRTVEWYKLFAAEGDPAPLTRKQITDFMA